MSNVPKRKRRVYQALLLIPIIALGVLAILGTGGGGGGGSSGGTVNVPPVASDSCEKTPLNVDLTGDLSSNVTDPDNTIFNFSLVNDGLKGSATIDPTGVFSYMPLFGARGIDSFSYRVDDLSGGQDTATVTVIIEHTRIMPLGDSITRGSGELFSGTTRVSYRKKLFEDLVAGGYMIDFVGGQSDGVAGMDPHHEGHGGFTAADIAVAVVGWLNANPADVILLHIGTNDFPSTATIAVADILDAIDSWEASNNNPVTVFLAEIINRDPSSSLVQDFNRNLVSLAQTRNVSGDKIVLVDQHSALDYPPTVPNDLFDLLHPTLTGYDEMADVWFADVTDPTGCFVKN